jgi:YggT family protein
MIHAFFDTLVTAITLYSLLCIARILMTWVPGSETGSIGKLLVSVTDPYLNWFKRFRFVRVGMLDFSPVLALGVLTVASMIGSTLAVSGKLTIGFVVASIVSVAWQFGRFFIILILVLLTVRLVFDILNRFTYSSFWTVMDRFLNKPIAWVTGLLSPRHPLGYRKSLILTLVFFILLLVALERGILILINLLHNLPF